MLKKPFIVIILGLALTLPFVSVGQTTAQTLDLQALVRELQEQVKALQAQVTSLQVQLATTREEVTATKEEVAEVRAELKITRSLERGATGDEVKELQEFLKKFPDIYPSGLVTGYFGPQTEAAVRKLQEKQGIEAIGVVGPKTLAKINELLTQGAGQSGVVPPGLLTAPGIQKKLTPEVSPTSPQATSTVPVVLPTPTSTPILAITTPPIVVSTATTTTETTATTTTYVPPATTPSTGQTTTQTTSTSAVIASSTVGSPPPAPSSILVGPNTASTGVNYSYSVQVYRDPDGDGVKPIFDWGDGTTFEWSDFMNPPATYGTGAQTSKLWTTAGTFPVKVKVKDATGRESGWGPIFYVTVSGGSVVPPVFTITSPNGGEQWQTSDAHTITWTSAGTSVSTVNIELRKGGTSVSFLGYNVANTGSLNWAASSTVVAGSDYKIRIYNPSSLYYNNFDESDSVFSIIIPADTTPPGAPASIGASASTSTQIYLQWQTSTDNVGVSGYKIYRNGSYLTSVAPLSYANSFTDTGLSPNTTYSYTVAAYDAAGNISPQTSAASATTQSAVMPPAAPSNFNLTSNNGSSTGFYWVDNSGDETEFRMERRSRPNNESEAQAGPWVEIGSVAANVTTYTDSNFPVTGAYDYRVKACNSAGCSAVSNMIFTILMQKSALILPAGRNLASIMHGLSEILLQLQTLLR